jgi:acylglycerol lipase
VNFLENFLTRNGHRLRGHVEGVHEAKGAVLVVHGMGDHARALPYLKLRAALVEAGWRVYSFDLPGYGMSEGDRVYTPAWRCLGDDVDDVIEAAAEHACARVFVVGLSLGGLLALNSAVRGSQRNLAGVVAIAPALSEEGAPWIVRKLLPWVGRFTHTTPFSMGLRAARVSRDASAVRQYFSDPLFQRKCSPGLALAVMEGIAEVRAGAGKASAPLLILHGGADKIAPPRGSAEFFAKAGAFVKKRVVYEGARHNLLIERNAGQVIRDILDWLAARA